MYGSHPGEQPGEAFTFDSLCDITEIEQPLGGRKKDAYCPPEPGHALLTNAGWVFPMFLRAPVGGPKRRATKHYLTDIAW